MRVLRCSAAAGCVLALAGTLAAQPATTSETQPPSEVGGKTLAQWMADLKHTDPCRRSDAIVNIIAFGEAASEAVPLLIERFQDKDASPRAKAVLAIKYIPVRERDIGKVVEALGRRVAEDPQAIVRYEAASALERFADDAKPVVMYLLKGMEDASSWEIRHACILALRRAAVDKKTGPDPRATRAMLAALHDPAEHVRLEATISLGAMTQPADPQLLAVVVNTLQQQLNRHDKALALWSNVSLLALDDKVTEKSLASISKLMHSPEREIRVQCLMAVGAMGAKARTLIPDVLEALEDKEAQVVEVACSALPHMDDHSARILDGLTKATQRKEPEIIYAACDALGQIGATYPEALEPLMAVTKRKELSDQLLRAVTSMIEKAKKPKKKN